MQAVKEKALELLKSGSVSRVLGWKTGEFFYDLTPAVFSSPEEVEREFVFSAFSGANLSKYLIAESRKEGKVAVFLKPCDSYSFVQLCKEHRIEKENVYVIGVACNGMCDMETIRDRGIKGVTAVREEGNTLVCDTMYGEKRLPRSDAMPERCRNCKSRRVVYFDEMLGENGTERPDCDRFSVVEKLEKMTEEERFAFWRGELSRCIRCNACRNVCPACSCEKCVFDNDSLGTANKAAASSFEEQNFHLIRAFHVAGRCTDCGECSRVCPQKIPLHLLNRKFIKDISTLTDTAPSAPDGETVQYGGKTFGVFQAGADFESRSPLADYSKEDCEPSVVSERRGDK